MENQKPDEIPKEEPKEEPKKKKSGKKILLWFLGIFLVGLLTLTGIAAWILSALFDAGSLPVVEKAPDINKYQTCIQKFQIQAVEGESTQDALLKDKTVELNKEEVNAVLDSVTQIARGYLAVKAPDTTIADVGFANGVLFADVSQKSPFSTPFGQYLNMRLAIIPRVENQHLYLEVKNLTVGSMKLSGDWVQKYIDADIKEFEKTENGQMVVNTLKGLKIENDHVKVTFNPMQVNMLLMQQALKIFSSDNQGDYSEILKLLQ